MKKRKEHHWEGDRLFIDGRELIEKHCKNCESTKKVKFFSKSNSSADGLQYVCKKCQGDIARERTLRLKKEKDRLGGNKLAESMMSKNKAPIEIFKKREIITEDSWDTTEGDSKVSRGMILEVLPIYRYLSSLKINKDGEVTLKKTVVEIIQFFDIEPKPGVELVYTYLKKRDGKHYINKKVTTVDEMAETYLSLIIPKKGEEQSEADFLLERFREMELKMNDLIEEVKNSNKLIVELTNQLS